MTPPLSSPPARPRRFWLYAPFIAAALAALVWSSAWFWLRGDVLRRMDAAKAGAVGYQIAWRTRAVSGFPFRLDIDLTGARLSEGTGWGVSAPRLRAEAFVFAPDHWVAVAADGAVLSRPGGGPVVIHARALRASLSEAAAHPPRLSVEGIDLAFITAPGGALFFLKQAGELHIHAKAGPGDQGAAYLEIDRAEAQGAGVIAAIADGRPTTLIADTLYSHASALSGSDADLALRHWAAAGGRATIRHVSLVAGSAGLEARAGEIGADGEGRLAGSISLKAREATRMIARLGAANLIAPEAARAAATVIGVRQAGGGVSLGLNFQAGRTTLGPVAIGAAPKLF